MILSKVGEININNDPLNSNYFYELPSPKDNSEFRQLIFYYHLMQYLPDMNEVHAYNSAWYESEGKNLSEVLKTISSKAKEVECGGIPFLISFEWKKGVVEASSEIIGHTEVVNGCESLSTGDQKIKLVDPNNQGDYDYLIINSGYDGFWFEDSSGQIIYANLPNWVGIGYQDISALKSIENNSLETLENKVMGVYGTTFIVDSNNKFEVSNQGSDVLTYNENGIESGIRPLNIDFVEGESESEDNSAEMKMTLPYSETYSVTPSEKGIDFTIVDDTRFADVSVTGAKEINFSLNNQIDIIGSNCNYEVLVPNFSNEGTVGLSAENSGNISIDRYQDGIRIKSDNMDDLKIKSLTINDVSEFNVKTDKSELLIKDKPNDENGLVELYISENNNDNFNKKIGETSITTTPEQDPSPGSDEPSSPGSGGGGGGGVTPTPTPNIDVTKALGEIAGASGGSTVTVNVTNNEPIPVSILEAARGKDINIVFNYGSYTWTLSGKSIQDLPAGVKTYDLSVKTIQNTTLSNLANDPNAVQIEISHNGAFPFTGQLTYQMDASLNGKTVYRYYFNETEKKLEYQDQATVKDGAVHFDFEHASKYVISALLKPETASVNCTYQTQLENIGWQGFKSNGEVSGTVGESLRLEGIEIKTDDPTKLGVTYQTHVQNIGWQGFKKNGEMSGTTGESLRLEGIQIKLTGSDAEKYDVYYQVYTEKFGWLDWAKNGESAGSEGYSYRLEAIKIVIQEKGTQAPGSTDKPFEKNVQCIYQTHVQDIGWQGFRTNGDMSGTQGQALRLEGIEIKFDGQENLGVEYSTHVQNIGWQDFVKDGAMSGTEGKSLRLEAIRIKLTGTDAEKYDIYYQVHAQNYGWLDWAKNGEESGTAGFGYRLEGIRIKVVPKGQAAPGNTAKPFLESNRMIP
ncbi:hypothetical protein LNN31_08425 [Acetobacterium wieringae]|uniref:Clostridial hydrophobic W n=1 Tax=Acetobacterium wieringae TaxID=52694 RepID=A0ABY6HKN6_9FIRM|nr:hypothetical protein [Acetobacterium wieringae]UYO64434.1 hypothetical protein LNN31_08425 [Acetobacterium wieringae]